MSLLLVKTKDEEDLYLAKEDQSISKVLMKCIHVVDEVRMRPSNYLQALAGDPQNQLKKDEYDNDEADDIVPLIIAIVLFCWYSIRDENGKRYDEGGKRDEERDECVDVDAESLELVESEEDREVDYYGPEVRHHVDV